MTLFGRKTGESKSEGSKETDLKILEQERRIGELELSLQTSQGKEEVLKKYCEYYLILEFFSGRNELPPLMLSGGSSFSAVNMVIYLINSLITKF